MAAFGWEGDGNTIRPSMKKISLRRLSPPLLGSAVAIFLIVGASGHARATGFATFFANLSSAGAVSISSGVHKAEKTGPGVYDVTFVRLVNNCSFTVSVTGATPGFASANRTTGR